MNTNWKSIKVIAANAGAIEAALSAANGKASAHAFTSYGHIEALAAVGERRLSALLYKKDFSGAVFWVTSGDAVANAYRNTRSGTRVVLTRKSADWYLTAATRQEIGRSGGKRSLQLTVMQDRAAREKVAENYVVDVAA